MKASGNRDEHELKRFAKNLRLDESGIVIANTDLVGHAYGRFKEDSILYLVIQSLNSETGVTMQNILIININDADYDNHNEPAAKMQRGNGKAHGSSVKKKKKDGSPKGRWMCPTRYYNT